MNIFDKIVNMKLKGIIITYSIIFMFLVLISGIIYKISLSSSAGQDVSKFLFNISVILFLLSVLFIIPVVIGVVLYSFRKSEELEKIKHIESGLILKEPKLIKREEITYEKVKDIAKEIIEETKSDKITKIQLPVVSEKTTSLQLTPEISVIITVKPNELIISRPEDIEEKVTEIKSEETKIVVPVIIKPIEQKIEVKKDKKQKTKTDKLQKLSYKTIIPMVLRGKGKKKFEDALSECKNMKDLREWDKIFPMAKSRFGYPILTTTTIENNIKIKYVEWVE